MKTYFALAAFGVLFPLVSGGCTPIKFNDHKAEFTACVDAVCQTTDPKLQDFISRLAQKIYSQKGTFGHPDSNLYPVQCVKNMKLEGDYPWAVKWTFGTVDVNVACRFWTIDDQSYCPHENPIPCAVYPQPEDQR